MQPNIHNEFKKALQLLDISISEFANEAIKPDGSKGVSRSAVTLVSQGKSTITWLREKIEQVIQKAEQKYPGYYAAQAEFESE